MNKKNKKLLEDFKNCFGDIFEVVDVNNEKVNKIKDICICCGELVELEESNGNWFCPMCDKIDNLHNLEVQEYEN